VHFNYLNLKVNPYLVKIRKAQWLSSTTSDKEWANLAL